MAEVMVIGGEGFIGKHLVRKLKSLKADTVSIDIESDITRFENCLRVISRENPKTIFHLAAQPLVETAKKSPFDTFETNVRGAYNLLESIRQVGKISALVWISTDKIYGENENAKEYDIPISGMGHPYNVSKFCGDWIARCYAVSYQIPIVIIRSGNIYGEADFHWDRLIPGTVRSLLKNERPILRSNGNLKRDYIYVDDIIEGYLLAGSALTRGEIKSGEAFNFGSESCYTSFEIVDKLLGISGNVDLSPIVQDRIHDELEVQHMDYSKANEMLDWNPKTSLDIGLEKTFNWYKGYMK